jgi:hypothetical protein
MIKRRKIRVPEQGQRAPDARDMEAEVYPRMRRPTRSDNFSNIGASYRERIRSASKEVDPKGPDALFE